MIIAGLVFMTSLIRQSTRPRYRTLSYWFCVVMVSVFGTMRADVAHVGLGIAYSVSTSVFVIVLIEGTLSIHSIVSARREFAVNSSTSSASRRRLLSVPPRAASALLLYIWASSPRVCYLPD